MTNVLPRRTTAAAETTADVLFAGPGEMRALCRAHDWSKTALGPVSGWSQAFKTIIGVVLRGPAPMYLVWGAQFVQIYNDLYCPVAGTRHPRLLGSTGREGWAETWPFVEPTYAAALAGQPATWSDDQPLLLNRKGFVEEAFFKGAIIPVPDETTASGIGGVFTTLTETTAQVQSERQRKTLGVIATRAAGSHSSAQACAATAAALGDNASDVPFSLLYLLSQDGREARLVAQSGFGPAFGPANPEVIDLTAPSAGAVGWPLASIVRSGATTVVKDLPERLGALPTGSWSQSPQVGIAVPLASPDRLHPYGVLIAGVNPHRALDEGYQNFFELVAGQVATAINEAALSRAHAETERARTLLFAQLMQAPMAVCVLTGPEFVFSLANPLYLDMMGRQEVVGKPIRTVFPELAHVSQVWEDVFSTGVPFVADEFGVAVDRGSGMEDRYYKFTVQPVRDVSGNVTDIMVVGIDVTAQVLARRRIEALVEELRQADQRKDEFLATLAHELRNPLAPIRNGLQLMRLTQGDANASERTRAMMERQVGQMVHLLDDLLDVSRISRDKISLRTERIELTSAIAQAIEISRPFIDQGGHELVVDVPPDPIYVDGDRTRLAQVFSNVLNNAAKYTPRGGHIRLTVQRLGSDAVISVTDDGIGIPSDSLTKIFDMFTHADRNLERSQSGLGIGLSIVRRLVELHGGSVEARSDGDGRGSELIVRLPVDVSGLGLERLDDATVARPTAAYRILVVDDNVDAAESLATVLTIMGHETRMAHDGLEALDVAAAFRPTVMLLDIGLPQLDGVEVCRRIRQQAWGTDMLVIALTGWGQDADKRRTLAAGADAHLVKPVEPAALEQLLAEISAARA